MLMKTRPCKKKGLLGRRGFTVTKGGTEEDNGSENDWLIMYINETAME